MNKRRYSFLLPFLPLWGLLIYATNIHGQLNLIQQQTIGQPVVNESIRGIETLPGGGYVMFLNILKVVPGAPSENSGEVRAYDAAGNLLWQKIIGASGIHYPRDIIVDLNGGILVVGSRSNDNDGWVVKLDAQGDLVWEKYFGGSDNDNLSQAVATSNGNYILTGNTSSNDGDVPPINPTNNHANWALEIDSDGNVIGSDIAFLLQGNFAMGRNILETSDGGYLIGGTASGQGGDVPSINGAEDYWLIKMDAQRNIEWSKTYGGASTETMGSLVATPDEGYLMAGRSGSQPSGDVSNHIGLADFWLVKVDADGNLLWEGSFGSPSYDYFNQVIVDPDGIIYATGTTRTSGGNVYSHYGGDDIWVIKLDPDGNLLAEQNFGGTLSEFASDLALSPSGIFVVGGTTSDDLDVSGANGDGAFDAWFIEVSSQVGGDIDLSLEMTANPTAPAIYSNAVVSLTITNEGPDEASRIEVAFPKPAELVYTGGSEWTATQGTFTTLGEEIWKVGDLLPGASATITVSYFMLTDAPVGVYAQVSDAVGNDPDSTPGNGNCCTPNEDDEAKFELNGTTSSCSINGMLINRVCSDNGTPNNENDDTFTFDFLVNGTDTGQNGWSVNIGGSVISGDYGVPQAAGPYTISNGSVPFTIYDNDDPSCLQLGLAVPIDPCSNAQQLICPGAITLSSQAEVDAWPGCTIVQGNLNITGADITDLSPLSSLQKVTALFRIEDTPLLTSLDDLENLDSVGRIFIRNNGSLGNLNGLNGLSQTEIESIVINANPRLKKVDGLNNFIHSGYLAIEVCDSLEAITGLQNLISVGGLLQIGGNPSLTDISGLSNVETVAENIQIVGNDALTTINGLGKVTTIAGRIAIVGNDLLTDLDGFQSLSNITSIEIVNNLSLLQIDALSEITSLNGFVRMVNNPVLNDCCSLFPLLSSGGVAGDVTINSNAMFCASEQAILNDCQPSGTIDLELSLAQYNNDPQQFPNLFVRLTLVNKSGQTATGVQVSFKEPLGVDYASGNEYTASQGSFDPYGNEIWTVGSLPAGDSATLEVNYIWITPVSTNAYAQVITANEQDLDSTPDNGTPWPPVANEDDEAHIILRPPCMVNAVVTGTSCHDNWTPNDPLDDEYRFTVLATNPNVGGSGWIANVDGLAGPLNASYGIITSFGPLNIFDYNTTTIEITDNGSQTPCATTLTVNAPPHCSYYNPDQNCVGNLFEDGSFESDLTPNWDPHFAITDVVDGGITGNALEVCTRPGDLNGYIYGIFRITATEPVQAVLSWNWKKLSSQAQPYIEIRYYNQGDLLSTTTFDDAPQNVDEWESQTGSVITPANATQAIVLFGAKGGNFSTQVCALFDDVCVVLEQPISQNSCPGDIVLTTQADINGWPGCAIVEGNLTISGPYINNLDSLISLEKVRGALTIENNPYLSSLSGLENLDSVGAFSIRNNAALSNLDGLENLSQTEIASLVFDENENLTEINGLNNFTRSGFLSIEGNTALESISGLNGLSRVGGLLQIENNPNLTDLSGLNHVEIIDQNLQIINNDALTTINGFQHLTEVFAIFIMVGNDLLQDIDGFANLSDLNSVVVNDNPSLQQINALGSLTSIGGNLTVTNNGLLNDCCGIFPLLNAGGVPGNISINGNLQHCLNEQAILDNCQPGGDIDLELSLLQNNDAPAQWSTYSVTATLTNAGGQTATGVKISFPKNNGIAYSGGNEFTASQGTFNPYGNEEWTVGELGAGQSATLEVNYFLLDPAAPDAYAQVSSANEQDADSTPGNGTPPSVNEDDEASTSSSPPNLEADLVLANLAIQNSPVDPGQNLTYSFDASNIGDGPAPGTFVIKAYISTDDSLSPDDLQDGLIDTGNFGAGQINSGILGASLIPPGLPLGDYFLILKIDAEEEVTESNEDNNTAVAPFTVESSVSGIVLNCPSDTTVLVPPPGSPNPVPCIDGYGVIDPTGITGCPDGGLELVLTTFSGAAGGGSGGVITIGGAGPCGSSFIGGPGAVKLTFDFEDACGNEASCVQIVQLFDITHDVTFTNCHDDIEVTAPPGEDEVLISYPSLNVSQTNCPNGADLPVPELIAGLPSNSLFPLGTTEVGYKAISCYGFETFCNFNVTVTPSDPNECGFLETYGPLPPNFSNATANVEETADGYAYSLTQQISQTEARTYRLETDFNGVQTNFTETTSPTAPTDNQLVATSDSNDPAFINLEYQEANGTVIWTNNFEFVAPGNFIDLTFSAEKTEVFDGFFLTGTVETEDPDLTFIPFIIKLDPLGNVLQQNLLPPEDEVISFSDLLDARDGGYYFQMFKTNLLRLIKIDASGEPQWINFLASGPPSITMQVIKPNLEGSAVFVANTNGQQGFFTRYASSDGHIIFSFGLFALFNGEGFYNSDQLVNDFVPTSDDGVVLGFRYNLPDPDDDGYRYGKLDNLGNELWSNVLPGDYRLDAKLATSDGGFLFTGSLNSADYAMMKVTSDGELTPFCSGTPPKDCDLVATVSNLDCSDPNSTRFDLLVTGSAPYGTDWFGALPFGNGGDSKLFFGKIDETKSITLTPSILTSDLSVTDVFTRTCAADFTVECGSIGGVDLELDMSTNNASPAIYSAFGITLTVNNTGSEPATGVTISFPKPSETVYIGGNEWSATQGSFNPFGNEEWNVGDVPAGGSASITVNYFLLTEDALTPYAQVSALNETDTDSSPGNGTCCTPLEDDEATILINGFNAGGGISLKSPERFRLLFDNIYPNPAKYFVTMEIFAPHASEGSIELYDQTGRQVLLKNVFFEKGNNIFQIPVSELRSGFYNVIARSDGHPAYGRFAKVWED
ncbi:MAG: T9SS type A sorting domain-containing protein [Bacteroidota bacterium]